MAKPPTAKQLAARQRFAELYGGKKTPRTAGTTMASKKSSKRRSSGGRRMFGLNTTSVLNGGIGGAASEFAQQVLPASVQTYAEAIGVGAVGALRKDDWLQHQAGYLAGKAVIGTGGSAVRAVSKNKKAAKGRLG